MNYYENVVIIDASLSDDNIEAAEQKIIDTIEKSEGEIIKREKWGRKRLAYNINKHDKGFYVLFVFKAPPSIVKILENLFKIYDPVFKFMIVRLKKKEILKLRESIEEEQVKTEEQEEKENEANEDNEEGEN